MIIQCFQLKFMLTTRKLQKYFIYKWIKCIEISILDIESFLCHPDSLTNNHSDVSQTQATGLISSASHQ